jgi:cytochrome c oxidase subunit 1
VPVLAGFGNYLVPLMIGARDMAFPRLNAASYWLFLLGGLVLLSSFLADQGGAQCGWTSYTPCSSEEFSPGHGQDLWILGVHLTGISSILGAINFMVTIHNMRAPGMTWMRIPLFTWAIEAYSVLLILVLPTIAAAATLLLLDRQAGTTFFAPEDGGPILWQHMFWFFGHPEVYIMVLPAMGIISEVIPVFSRKPIFGYKAVAFSTIGIAFASMLVWAHHMFTVGMPSYLQAFFAATSLAVAVPTSVKIFNWLATLWRGTLILRAPLMFALGFIGLFTIGGLTGIMLAVFPFDYQPSSPSTCSASWGCSGGSTPTPRAGSSSGTTSSRRSVLSSWVWPCSSSSGMQSPAGAPAGASARTRGGPTRSSGTPRRRPDLTTSTAFPT